MKAAHYGVGIAIALVAGTVLGKTLFPKREIVVGQGGEHAADVGRVSALPPGGGLGMTPEQVFAGLSQNRASSNPGRSELEMRLKLRAMSDAEILELAKRLAAREFSPTQYESFFVTEVWERYASIDPQSAYMDALRLETRVMRRAAANIAAESWAHIHPTEALAAFIGIEAGDNEVSPLGRVLDVLVKNNPQRAVAALDEHREESWYSRARGSLFQSWSAVDKEAAQEWLVGQMDDDPASAGRILRDLATVDPAAALDITLGMEPNAHLRDAVVEMVTRPMMWMEPDAAVAKLQSIPGGWLSRRMAAELGRNGVTKWPNRDLYKVGEILSNEGFHGEFWHAVVGRRASDGKFDDATDLLGALGAGRHRDRAFADVATYWAKLNPAEASEWLTTLDPGIDRDHAVGSFAMTIAPLDPDSARKWAESIRDSKLRARALKNLR